MGNDDQFRVSVVLYQEDGLWIAQGLQYDITARGENPVEASDRFNQKFGAELIMSMEMGEKPVLAGVPKAPQEFWKMYEAARMHANIDESPIQLTEGRTSHVVQDIKITQARHLAA